MKTRISLQATRLTVRNSVLTIALCILATHLAIPAMGQSVYSTPYTFTTLAGNPGSGISDGTASAARFTDPKSVAVDGAGNLYVVDGRSTVRKIMPVGTNWVVATLAGLAGSFGSADGTGSAARFGNLTGVAVDSAGTIYVADAGNGTIRKVTATGVVTTLVGLAGCCGLAVDSATNLYASDTGDNTIRKISPAGTNWVVTTLAGSPGSQGSTDGTGSAARFYNPRGVAVDGAGNVYVADFENNTVRKVTPAGVVTTLAGKAGSPEANVDATGSAARFWLPWGVAADSAGNVYVADFDNNTIRKITAAGAVTTLAGLAGSFGSADGTGSAARFTYPTGVAVDSATNVYAIDRNNNIRKITPAGVVTTLVGVAGYFHTGSADGTGSAATFFNPRGIAVDTASNLYVADSGYSIIRKVTPTGDVTTLAGRPTVFGGSSDGIGSGATFSYPNGMAVDTSGNVYVADNGNETIRMVTPAGVVTTLLGLAHNQGTNDGIGNQARFHGPCGVALDTSGNLYVSDSGNNTIRRATLVGTNWVVTTFAGLAGISGASDGTGSTAQFNDPIGLAVDNSGNVYVADYNNFTIRKITSGGVVTTLAGLAGSKGNTDGTGSAARFNYVYGLAVDTAGNVYVANSGPLDNSTLSTIRKVTPAGEVTTLGGVANGFGSVDGTGSAARFWEPWGVAVDSANNLYVVDSRNATIRKGFPASSVPAPQFQPPLLNAGQFGFALTGASGLAVDIQSSTDLSSWQTLGTYTLAGGTNYCVAPTPPQGTQFFRAHVR